MADDPKPTDPAPTDPPNPTPPPATGPDDVEAMKAALKKANKEAEQARLKLKELEDAGKSDLEKAITEANDAKARATAAETALMRARIARKHGLDDDDMDFIHGTTEEEIEASAVKLAGRILKPAGDPPPAADPPQADPTKPAPSQRPAPNLTGGGDPTEPVEETDPAKLAAAIPRS